MKTITSRVLFALLGSMLALGACNAQPAAKSANDGVAATVNGTPIKQAVIDAFMQQRAAQGAPDTPEVRKALLEELISREVVKQAAVKEGIDKRPDVQMQMDLARQNILLNAYVQDYIKKHPITDDMIKAEYDKIKAQIGDKQYHARHILVADKKEAEAIIAQLAKGAKFEKLAQQKSKDSSAQNGGDLGWNVPTAYVKPFADALVSLKKGEYTKTPVQSQFGWHVIKLEDVKDAPKLDELKPQLIQRLQQQQLQQMAAELRAKAKIEYATPAESK
ncbi:peptidylprolyl isomerase [Thiobacter aerophilum]|uniref:peptidylprolyl isomerase n=1 Tax=Thiobacter aerophilum TaxID=3121275 RepID=A0ABV0EEG1_9BURK